MIKTKIPGPWYVSLIIERLFARQIKSLEYDPAVQYRFHQSFMFFWIVAMVGVAFIPAFHHNVASLLIMEVSLYANFATDFGAMSSALAAGNYHCKGCNCDADIDVGTKEAQF